MTNAAARELMNDRDELVLEFAKWSCCGNPTGFTKNDVETLCLQRMRHPEFEKYFAHDWREGRDWWTVIFRRAT